MADEPSHAPRQQPWFRRFAKLWGFALFVVLIAVFFRHVLLPFIFAVVLAYILAPAVNRLSRVRLAGRNLPRGLSVLLCYIVLVGAIVLFVLAFLPKLSADMSRLAREGPGLWERVDKEWTPAVARFLERKFPALVPKDVQMAPAVDAVVVGEPPPPPGTILTMTPLPNGDVAITVAPEGIEVERRDDKVFVVRPREEAPPRRLEDQLRARLMKALVALESQADEVLRFGQALIAAVLTAIYMSVLVLMLAAFILIDMDRLHNFARGLIPARYRKDYDVIVIGIDRGLSGVIRGQLLICLTNGVLTYIGLIIYDVKYALLLGMVAGVMSLIPIFGSILSSVPIVGLALVSSEHGIDLLRGVFVLLWIIGIHFIEANFLNPKIIGTTAKMHPVLVIFSLIAGEHTYGLVGALFAVPVASIIQTLFLYFRRQAWKQEGTGSFTAGGP